MRYRAFYGVYKACSAWLSEFGIASNGEIYNAVDPSFITGEAKKGRADFRASLGLAADAPVISFSGRLIREKGVLQLAEALPGIRRDVPGAALLLAGDGPLAETLAGRHVRGLYLLGQLPYADSLALIAQSDVFCLPTRSEGFSGAVLEAAALGTPVITTATGGSPELIDSGESGILIPDMSAKSVETACARALSDREWRVCAAQKARARLLARFTWDRSAEALLSAVERLIKDNGDR